MGRKAIFLITAMMATAPLRVSPQDAPDQPLHLCALPRDPIRNETLLSTYGFTKREEYLRYFNELNEYLMCLEHSKADAVSRGNTWAERFRTEFPDG